MTRTLLTAGLTGAVAMLAAAAYPGIPARAEIAAAQTQGPNDPFASLVGKRRERAEGRREVERYVTASGERAFLLESDGDEARVKFLCRDDDDPRLDCRIDPEGAAEEIFLLTVARGSRGGMLFRDAYGDTVLRIAAHGGATVRWPGEPYEKAASKSFAAEAGPLQLAPARRAVAHRRAQSAAAHLSALVGSPIVFDVGLPPPQVASAQMSAAPAVEASGAENGRAALMARAPAPTSADAAEAAAELEQALPRERRDASVLADAVARAAGGMHMVASDPLGARAIGARIAVVRFVEAQSPGLVLDGATLTVFYNPHAGLAGRPSSKTVARFLEETL